MFTFPFKDNVTDIKLSPWAPGILTGKVSYANKSTTLHVSPSIGCCGSYFQSLALFVFLPLRLALALRLCIVNIGKMAKKGYLVFFLPLDGMDLETNEEYQIFYMSLSLNGFPFV